MLHTGQRSDRACHAQVCMFAAEAGRASLQSGVLCSDSMMAALAPCGRAPPKQAARQKRGPGAHPAKDSTPTTSRTAARQLRRSPAAQRFFPVALPLTRGKDASPCALRAPTKVQAPNRRPGACLRWRARVHRTALRHCQLYKQRPARRRGGNARGCRLGTCGRARLARARKGRSVCT